MTAMRLPALPRAADLGLGIGPGLATAPRALPLATLAIAAMVPVSLLGLWLDPRLIDAGHAGLESVWLKPLRFQLALVVHLGTIALCLRTVAATERREAGVRRLVAAIVACAAFEAVYITARGAAGLRSHFASGLSGNLGYALMGLAATLLVVATALVGMRILRARPAGEPHRKLAAGLGLAIGGIAGLVTGATISIAGGPLVGAEAGGAVMPLFGWSTAGGDLRVAHFVGLHTAQALPLFALAAGARVGTGSVRLAALALVAATTAAYALALAGQSVFAAVGL